MRVVQLNANSNTFDVLRYHVYRTSKDKTLQELPPTSSAIHGHLLSTHYFVNVCLNLLERLYVNVEPLNFAWVRSNGMLLPGRYLQDMPK